MEWLEGEALAARLRCGVVPLAETSIGLEVLTAPGASPPWYRDRDLRPSNIVPTPTEQAPTLAWLGQTGDGALVFYQPVATLRDRGNGPRTDAGKWWPPAANSFATGAILYECPRVPRVRGRYGGGGDEARAEPATWRPWRFAVA